MSIDVQTFRATELGNSAHLLIDQASSSAVIIDPARDSGGYLAAAEARGVSISWALETHVHNDFVSGGRELVATVGARLGASRDAALRYPYEPLADGDEIGIGTSRLRVLATPGHTPEHVAYLLVDARDEPVALFSGGVLMVGTAARTDLFGPALSWRFAHDLERSLRQKVLSLPDHVEVYPTHGGGSFCATGAGTATSTSIGAERAANRLVRARSSRQFVTEALTAGTYPAYYARMRALNQTGAPLIGAGPPTPAALGPSEVEWWLAQGAVVIDVRSAAAFRAAHLPDSLAVGADGNVSGWVGWLVGPERPLVVVGAAGDVGTAQVSEATRQLSRIGYDRVVGHLAGGVDAWSATGRDLLSYQTTNAAALAKRLDADELLAVVDVREAAEWYAGHVPGSVNLPAHDIPTSTVDLPRGCALVVHCGHDYRATLGASLLERAGYHGLTVLDDGWEGWTALEEQT